MSNHTREGERPYSASPDQQKNTGGDVRAEAERTGEQIRHQGEEIASAARETATGFARDQKQAGAAGIDSVARAVDKAADELEETSPELARHTRDAAAQVHSFSERLREKSIGGIVDDLTGYAKREPAAFLGVAVVAGFALSRFLGARTESGDDAGNGHQRDGMNRGGAAQRGAGAGMNAGAPASMSNENRNDHTAGRL